MNPARIANMLLRLGIGFAFLYPPLAALESPDSWIGYFPKFLHGIMPDTFLLHGFGFLEIAIALSILFGKKIFWPSMVAAFVLIVIVLANLNNFEVLFRDVALAGMALALAVSAEDSLLRRTPSS